MVYKDLPVSSLIVKDMICCLYIVYSYKQKLIKLIKHLSLDKDNNCMHICTKFNLKRMQLDRLFSILHSWLDVSSLFLLQRWLSQLSLTEAFVCWNRKVCVNGGCLNNVLFYWETQARLHSFRRGTRCQSMFFLACALLSFRNLSCI